MVNPFKLWLLKRKVKHYYRLATYLPDYVDCGLEMFHVLRPDLAAYIPKFNAAMDELAKLDPLCPTYRMREPNG